MRWADLGPTPGRRPSWSISSWTWPAYKRLGHLPEEPAEAAHVEAAHGLLREVVDLADGVVDGGEHQVFEHGDVVGIDGVGVDGDRPELHAAGDGDLHHAAARMTLDDLLGRS